MKIAQNNAAVFFDIDGTVLHLKEPVSASYNRILRHFGYYISEDELGSYISKLWKQSKDDYLRSNYAHATSVEIEIAFWKLFAEEVIRPFTEPSHRKEIAEEIYEYFNKGESREFDPHFPDVVKKLHSLGASVGAITNNDIRTHAVLKETGLRELFSSVFTAGELGFKKPSPEIFIKAQERTSIPRTQLWYVGDTMHLDSEPALKAGWNAILLVTSQEMLKRSEYDKRIHLAQTLNDIPNIMYG